MCYMLMFLKDTPQLEENPPFKEQSNAKLESWGVLGALGCDGGKESHEKCETTRGREKE